MIPWALARSPHLRHFQGMRYDAPDVSPAVADIQARRYRAMTPDRKLALADALWELACDAASAGVRMRHPELDEAAVERAARDLMRRASE